MLFEWTLKFSLRLALCGAFKHGFRQIILHAHRAQIKSTFTRRVPTLCGYLSRRCTLLLHSNWNWFSCCGSQSMRNESICFGCSNQFKDGHQQHCFRGDLYGIDCLKTENAKENGEMLLMSSWCIMKASSKWSLATGIRHLSKECYNFKFHNHLARDKQKHNVVFGFFFHYFLVRITLFFCVFLFFGRNLSHFINILELSLYSTVKTNNV